MRNLFLKVQLWFLFLSVVTCSLVFYYKGVLPDNVFEISSSNLTIGIISYYTTSFLIVVDYFLGPWVLISFLFFAFNYALILSKRERLLDVLDFFFVNIFIIGVTFFSFPVLLGDGLYFLLKQYLPSYIVAMSISISLLFLFKSMKINFLNIVKRIRYNNTAKEVVSEESLNKEPKRYAKLILDAINPKHLIKKLHLKLHGKWRSEDNKEINYLKPETETPKISTVEEVVMGSSLTPTSPEVMRIKEMRQLKTPFKRQISNLKSQDLINCVAIDKKLKRNILPSDRYFQEIIEKLEDKFEEFKVNAKVINVLKGPVVDTFELELGPGVKVAKVTSLSEDLGLALHGSPIRMVYPLEGRTTVGVEVPRNPREIIYLDEVLGDRVFKKTTCKLPIAMGKDAFGKAFVVDLTSMPHMLVAGSTGSGKSVFINALLVSLLVKMSPDDLKLILIDPKQLELAQYEKLPHLALPIITEPRKSSAALLWACQEMEKRYSMLRKMGVRNLEGYNQKILNCSTKELDDLRKFRGLTSDEARKLPYVVIIVDEFADLVLTKYGKEVENAICRLAAKARAAGIHLVVATQRPSVDVITGLIKSNFPTRVSFRVSSSIDSRTILTAVGAERLLGKGDMLYKHGIEMRRLHSSFVEEREIELLVEKLAKVGANFDDEALDFIEKCEEGEATSLIPGDSMFAKGAGEDDLYDEALQVVVQDGSASASRLQRRLRIGYNRAANLIEVMEKKGVVGPGQGARPRKVLISANNP